MLTDIGHRGICVGVADGVRKIVSDVASTSSATENNLLDLGLRLSQIQGNIIPGFGAEHQGVMLARFGDVSAGREWLSTLRSDITSAADILLSKQRNKGGVNDSATYVNMALSWSGMQHLGAYGLEEFLQSSGLACMAGLSPWVMAQPSRIGRSGAAQTPKHTCCCCWAPLALIT